MEVYVFVIGRTATGYSAHCPDGLGCAATGKTVEEVVARIKEASPCRLAPRKSTKAV
jgi:predicted RNase H-like HicB family nuclease